MRLQKSMDLTTGPVFRKLVVFVLPILLSNLLQQLYNSADTMIAGQFAGKTAIAAVGSTASVTLLILNICNGLSVGANVICANLFGAKEKDELDQCMHTSMLLSVVLGVVFGIAGLFIARPVLTLMGTPPQVIGQAVLYMRIYFCGVPASMVFNFGSAILRATGDTKRPMYILVAAGALNVVLNLLFVIVFHWDVAGVAIATVISQTVSAVAVCKLLFDPNGEYGLSVKQLQLHRKQLLTIIRVGIPCGLNGIVFSSSNVLVQSAINSLGDVVMAGNVAAGSLNDFIFIVMSSFYTATVSFAGQCTGAREYRRIDKLLLYSIGICIGTTVVLSVLFTAFPVPLMRLYAKEMEVIQAGIPRLILVAWSYLFYSLVEPTMGCLRGMRKFTGPTVVNIFATCVPRLIWIFFFFPMHRTLEWLMLCYPISWLICGTAQLIYYGICRKKLEKAETVHT